MNLEIICSNQLVIVGIIHEALVVSSVCAALFWFKLYCLGIFHISLYTIYCTISEQVFFFYIHTSANMCKMSSVYLLNAHELSFLV
jgi:hypothetical protein